MKLGIGRSEPCDGLVSKMCARFGAWSERPVSDIAVGLSVICVTVEERERDRSHVGMHTKILSIALREPDFL